MEHLSTILLSHAKAKRIFMRMIEEIQQEGADFRIRSKLGPFLLEEIEEVKFFLMSLIWMRNTSLWLALDSAISSVGELAKDVGRASHAIHAIRVILTASTRLLHDELCAELERNGC